jgi:hypothetical protein
LTGETVLSFREEQTGLDPSFLSCLGCSQVVCDGVPLDALNLPAINPVPGATLGEIFSETWCLENPSAGLRRALTSGGTDTLFLRGAAVGSLYLVRETPHGLCLAFPGSPLAWYERPVHPDDRFVIFGNDITYADIQRHESVWQMMVNGLQSGRLTLGVQRVLRLR